jgi:hypothetical protein
MPASSSRLWTEVVPDASKMRVRNFGTCLTFAFLISHRNSSCRGQTAMRLHPKFLPIVTLFLFAFEQTAAAGTEVVATQGLTVQSEGPRSGDAGKKYFNVQGKSNERYASFGVLAFELPKDVNGKRAKGLKLTLSESTPKFAKEGAVKVFLAPDFDPEAELKFKADVEGGVGKQIEPLLPLGSGEFKSPEQGKATTFELKLDDKARDRIAKGGKVYLVVVPADDTVAATYFGTEADADKRPRLTIELP